MARFIRHSHEPTAGRASRQRDYRLSPCHDQIPGKSEQDKIKAELELLKSVKRYRTRNCQPVLKAYEAIEMRAKSGKFNGQDGAYGAMATLLKTTKCLHVLPTPLRSYGKRCGLN